MSLLRRVRLAEWLIVAWMLLLGAVYATQRTWGGMPVSAAVQGPLWFLVVCILTRYALGLAIVSGRKLVFTWRMVFAPSAAIPDGVRFDVGEETDLLRSLVGFLRDCAPLFFAVLFYPTTDFLIDRLQGPFLADPILAELDLRLFGGHWSVWMERLITPARTEWLSLCYFLHLVYPTAILLFLHLRAGRRLFLEAIQGFVAILLVGFAIYLLVPAVGPKYALAGAYTRDLGGATLRGFNDAVIEATRAPRDAFPSLHVGLSALLLVYAWRGSRTFALVLLPFIASNWVATVYLRYHYTVDLVAGFLLVPIIHGTVAWWMATFPVPEAGDGGTWP